MPQNPVNLPFFTEQGQMKRSAYRSFVGSPKVNDDFLMKVTEIIAPCHEMKHSSILISIIMRRDAG